MKQSPLLAPMMVAIAVIGCGKEPPDYRNEVRSLSTQLEKQLKDERTEFKKELAEERRAAAAENDKVRKEAESKVLAALQLVQNASAEVNRAAEGSRKETSAAVKKFLEEAKASEVTASKARSEAATTAAAEQKKVVEDLKTASADFSKKLGIVEQKLHEVLYPPQPAGEKELFELMHESTAALRLKTKKEGQQRDHVAVYLVWPEARKKPDVETLKRITALYRLGEANVTDEVLQAFPSNENGVVDFQPKEDATARAWFVAWKYDESKKPLPFVHIVVYRSRIRVLWYPIGTPEKPKLEPRYREALLDLGRSVGATRAGQLSLWNPKPQEPGSELIYRD